MVDGSDDATCLLGLGGLAVERVALAADGVKIVALVTSDPDAARCPGCREVSTPAKEWVLTRPKDLPCGGMVVVMQWRKRRWRCRTQDCPRQTFTERVGQVPAGMRTTTRLRECLARSVEDGRDQAEVAAAYGVSWPTVQRALVDYAQRELAEPEPTTVLGMDETRFGRPRWLPDGSGAQGLIRWRRSDPWETGFVDLVGDQALLGQVDGRTSAAVRTWLLGRSARFRDAIEVVVIDPHAGYAAAVRAALPHARIAVDHFHLIMLANRAVTTVRQGFVALAKPRHARPLILGWSDRLGQLVEGGRHPQGHRLVNAEFVVAATDVLDERVSGDDDSGSVICCQAAHRPQAPLQLSVICFHSVVNRYERSSVVGLAGRSALGGVLVGIRCDRPGQGRWE